MSIFYLCPTYSHPVGGVRKIYRHVDFLNQSGFSAYVLHGRVGFRCRWFQNDTAIAYTRASGLPFPLNRFKLLRRLHNRLIRGLSHSAARAELSIVLSSTRPRLLTSNDTLVIPEILWPDGLNTRAAKVVFNQNCYLTFTSFCDLPHCATAASPPEDLVDAMITISEDSEAYLRYAFPKVPIHRIRHYSIDTDLFRPGCSKEKCIAFMPRKNAGDAKQVLHLLGQRGILREYTIQVISGISLEQTASILRKSRIFLSFGHPEGFGLPPAEAMACECIVIGYHGMGGREFFKPEFSYPVEAGYIVKFAEKVEHVMEQFAKAPAVMQAKAEMASRFVRTNYGPEAERAELAAIWTKILAGRQPN